mmetsp:Transcript_5984/g.14263  ORF Transcript_5984/g.14263 Transcript_5984/m.14263 type:complete len:316 (+) Transcript_5984:793-1740(+)
MLDVSIQKLVHNIHDIRQPCDLTDLLKSVFGGLALLHLFIDNLLKAIPGKLLDSPKLSEPTGRSIESFICCLQSNLVSPPLKIVSSPNCTLHRSNGILHFLQRFIAQILLGPHLVLEDIQQLLGLDPVLVNLPALVQLLLDLLILPLEVLLHLEHLLLQHSLFLLDPLEHVLVHLLLSQSLRNLLLGVRESLLQGLPLVVHLEDFIMLHGVLCVRLADGLPEPAELLFLALRFIVHIIVLLADVRQNSACILHSAVIAGSERVDGVLNQGDELCIGRGTQRKGRNLLLPLVPRGIGRRPHPSLAIPSLLRGISGG